MAGEQPEDICHGWTARCLVQPHWSSAFSDLEEHRDVAWHYCFCRNGVVGTSPTHISLEGCTCWWVGEAAVPHVTQHLFPAPPAWGCMWLCWGYHSVQRSVPGAVFPALCLAIFILGVGNAFLQEAHLLINPCSRMAGLLQPLCWPLLLLRTITETRQLTGQDKSGFSTTAASAHLWLQALFPPPLAGPNRTVKSLWYPLGGVAAENLGLGPSN